LLINASPQGVSVTLTQSFTVQTRGDGESARRGGKIAGTDFTLDKTLYIVKSLYIKTGLTGATDS